MKTYVTKQPGLGPDLDAGIARAALYAFARSDREYEIANQIYSCEHERAMTHAIGHTPEMYRKPHPDVVEEIRGRFREAERWDDLVSSWDAMQGES